MSRKISKIFFRRSRKTLPVASQPDKSQVPFFISVKKRAFSLSFCSKRAHFCQFLRIFAHFWTFSLLHLCFS
jgi:hypothetical protein